MNATTLPLSGAAVPVAPVPVAPRVAAAPHPSVAKAAAAQAVVQTNPDVKLKEQTAAMARAQRRRTLARWLAPVLGFIGLLLVWQLISHSGDKQLPGPGPVWTAAVQLFADPFYIKGPNDQGIGWNIL
jgi:nitrate/nitrite transport system permease protein